MTREHIIGLAVLALLVIGAAAGRASVEPVIVKHQPTKTIVEKVEVPGPTETVYVDNPFPQACLDMVDVAYKTNQRTFAGLNLITEMTDALGMARAGVAGQNSAWLTEAENRLRRIDSRSLNFLPSENLGGDPLAQARRECEAELQ